MSRYIIIIFFFIHRSRAWILLVHRRSQLFLHDYVHHKHDLTRRGDSVLARATRVANVAAAAATHRRQCADGLLRHEARRRDNTNVDEIETLPRKIAPVDAVVGDVPVRVSEGREANELPVHPTNLQVELYQLQLLPNVSVDLLRVRSAVDVVSTFEIGK